MLIQIIVSLSLTYGMNAHMKRESNTLIKDLAAIIETEVSERALESLKADVNELSTLLASTERMLIMMREFFLAQHHVAQGGATQSQASLTDAENFCVNSLTQLPESINGLGSTFELGAYSDNIKYFLPYAYRDEAAIKYSVGVHIDGHENSDNVPDQAKEDYMESETSLDYYTSSVPKDFDRNTASPLTINWTEPYVDYIANVVLISATTAISDKDKTLGVAFVDLSLESLEDILRNMGHGSKEATGFAFSLKSQGVLSVLGFPEYAPKEVQDPDAYSLEDKVVQITNVKDIPVLGPKVLELFGKLKKGEDAVDSVTYKNQEYNIVAINEMDLFGIVLMIPHNVLYADTNRAKELLDHLYMTQEKDLKKVQITTVAALVIILGLLAGIMIFVVNATKKLFELAKTLTAVAGDIDGISHRTNEISDELDTDSREQLTSLTKTSEAVREIMAQIQSSYDATKLCKQAMEETTNEVKHGGSLARDVKTTMDRISDTTNKISGILHTMQSIAFQTNLLALNASVEAARAGELGQGFAVVAGEVRTLSLRSNEAAEQSDSLMEVAVNGAKDGEKYSKELTEGFDRIGNSADNVTMHVESISNASGEQKQALESISASLDELNNVIEVNNTLAQKSLDNSHALEEKAESLNSSADELKTLVMGKKAEEVERDF
jgi:methyl-accepting chemotaxis protein